MILDYRNNPEGPLERTYQHGRVLVDGVEISQAFYIDTLEGIVRTYDVDETHRPTYDSENCGAQFREVRGKVKLLQKADESI